MTAPLPNKNPFRKALNKVQDFVADSNVERVASIATGVLDIAAQIGQAKIGGPIAFASAAVGTLHVIQENLGVTKVDVADQFISDMKKTRGVKTYTSGLPELLMKTGAISALKTKVLLATPSFQLLGIEQGDELLMFKRFVANDVCDYSLWRTKDFDFVTIRDAFWEVLGGPIAKMQETGSAHATLAAFQYDETPYLGEHSPAEFAAIYNQYKARGISRSAFLQGPPGTGKTSFVRAYARYTNGRLLIVPPAFLASHMRNEIEVFTELMQPNILMIDDIDHSPQGLEYALTLIDDLRRRYPQMLVVTTCNQLVITNTTAALLRPGRLGERLKFLAPNSRDKLIVLKYYLGHYGVSEEGLDLESLVENMTHENFSHDYVRFVAEQAVTMSHDKLMSYVSDLNEYLEAMGEQLLQQSKTAGALAGLRGQISSPPEESPDYDYDE